MEISLEDVVLNNLKLGVLVNFEPEENEAFDAENTKVYGKEEHNNPLELFPNESEENQINQQRKWNWSGHWRIS